MLTACATTGPDIKVVQACTPPVLPQNLRSRVPDPGIRVGKPAKVEMARNRVAYKKADAKQVLFVSFYDDLRSKCKKR